MSTSRWGSMTAAIPSEATMYEACARQPRKNCSTWTVSIYFVSEYTTGMSLRINEEAPNFTAETTQGTIDFHQWIGDGWAILFSHPKDFTPVCTTELGYMAGLEPDFDKRNT